MDRRRRFAGFSRALWALTLLLAAPACTDVDAGSPPEPGRPAERTGGIFRPEQSTKTPPAPPAASVSTSVQGEVVNAGQSPAPDKVEPQAAPAPQGGETAQAALQPEQAPASSGSAAAFAGSSEEALAIAVLSYSDAQPNSELARAATSSEDRERLVLAFVAALRGTQSSAVEELGRLEKSKNTDALDLDCLRAAVEPAKAQAAALRALGSGRALPVAMGLALLEREGQAQMGRGEFAPAAQSFSRLLQHALKHGWSEDRAALARWTQALEQAQTQYRWSPHGQWPSIEVKVQSGDHLIGIRKRVLTERPDLLVSTGLIARANRLRSENSLRLGETLKIPTERASALVDVSARWVLFLIGDEVACAFEVGVGKQAGSTRTGSYTIGDKREEPMWFAQGREPVPFGDPENPLGTRWMAWYQDGKATSLGFHGTNDEKGIGYMVSEGCIRMRNADVERLFDILPKDASVLVQP